MFGARFVHVVVPGARDVSRVGRHEACDRRDRDGDPPRGDGRDGLLAQWNECPQAQPPWAAGLSIVKPVCSSESTKSTVACDRYGTDILSITTRTPCCSPTVSLSDVWSSRYIA